MPWSVPKFFSTVSRTLSIALEGSLLVRISTDELATIALEQQASRWVPCDPTFYIVIRA